jgi:hypothetical protein
VVLDAASGRFKAVLAGSIQVNQLGGASFQISDSVSGDGLTALGMLGAYYAQLTSNGTVDFFGSVPDVALNAVPANFDEEPVLAALLASGMICQCNANCASGACLQPSGMGPPYVANCK